MKNQTLHWHISKPLAISKLPPISKIDLDAKWQFKSGFIVDNGWLLNCPGHVLECARARDDGRARWREKFTQKCGRIWLIMRYSCNLFIGLIPQLHSQTAMKMKSPNLFIINSLCNTLIRKSYDNCICIRFLWQSQWRLGSMEERAHGAWCHGAAIPAQCHSSEHYSQICNER